MFNLKKVIALVVIASGLIGSSYAVDKPAETTSKLKNKVEVADQVKTATESNETITKENVKVIEDVIAVEETATTPPKNNKQESKAKSDQPTMSKEKTKAEPELAHVHDWEPIYSYETIEDIGHELREICKGCGADITSWSTSQWNAHSDGHLKKGEPAGFYEKEIKVVTGTHEVKKITGYKCSCGVTK